MVVQPFLPCASVCLSVEWGSSPWKQYRFLKPHRLEPSDSLCPLATGHSDVCGAGRSEPFLEKIRAGLAMRSPFFSGQSCKDENLEASRSFCLPP